MEMSFFWKLRNAWWRLKGGLAGGASSGEPAAPPAADPGLVHVPGFAPVRFRGHAFDRSTEAVDVVVLAHDDLPVLEECLGALLRHARPPYTLFLADPGVSPAARSWLEAFARDQGAALVRGRRRLPEGAGRGRVTPRSPARRARARRGGRPRPADRLSRLRRRRGGRRSPRRGRSGRGPGLRARRARAGRRGSGAPATLLAAESARLFPASEEGGGCAAPREARGIARADAERSPREVLARMRADAKRILLADDTWVAGASAASAAASGAPDRVVAGIAARFAILPERVGLRERARRRCEGKRVLYVLPGPRARGRVERRAVGGAGDDADGRRGARLQPRGPSSRLREELSRAGRSDRLRARVRPRRGRAGVRRRDRDGPLLGAVDGAAREAVAAARARLLHPGLRAALLRRRLGGLEARVRLVRARAGHEAVLEVQVERRRGRRQDGPRLRARRARASTRRSSAPGCRSPPRARSGSPRWCVPRRRGGSRASPST